MTKRPMQIRLAAGTTALTLLIASLSLTAQNRSPVAPRDEQVRAVVNDAYNMFKNESAGKNADYIPALAKVDSKLFGIAVISTDNKVVTVGDVDKPFSIQSISKVFTLALAMNERGVEDVFKKIGSEPTGRAFNSVDAVVDMP